MLKKLKQKREKQKEFIKNLSSAYDDAKISWIAPEHARYKRGVVWKIIAVLAVVTAVVLGIIFNAWTFSLAVIVFAFVYYLIHLRQEIRDIEVAISDFGIKMGERKYPFSHIKAFWIIYEPPFTKTLNIRVNNDLLQDVKVQLNEQNPATIRKFLAQRVPELEGQTESVSDIFLKIFKIS